MSRRVGRPRKLDYAEVVKYHADTGGTIAETAAHFGVADPTIRRIVIPGYAERQSEWQKTHRPWIGVCAQCGGAASNGQNQRAGSVCWECHVRNTAVSVRPTTLRCGLCRLWLPDEDFPHKENAKARRHRHPTCTRCGRIAKRDWRAANLERSRAYERERARRARAALP